jgi:hypothetical protein
MPVRFAAKHEAASVLGTDDAFAEVLSDFDRGIRLQTVAPVTTADYLAYAQTQALDWSATERTRFAAQAKALELSLAGLSLELPESVLLVQSTGEEDFESPYTRGAAIIIPQDRVFFDFYQLLAHELLHVATRHDPTLRNRLYPLLGFSTFSGVQYPAALESRRITNPDAFELNATVQVSTDDGRRDVVPILQSSLPLDAALGRAQRLSVVELQLLEVDPATASVVLDADGNATVLGEAATDYDQVAGINTDYTLHAEEVLADNFSLLMLRRAGDPQNVPHPEVLDAIEAELTSHSRN